MTPDELQQYFQAPAGFLGPVGLTVLPAWALRYDRGFTTATSLAAAKGLNPEKTAQLLDPRAVTVVLDAALEGRANMVCGANRLDYHLRNVTPGRDFRWTLAADIRNAAEGEPDPIDGSPLRIGKAVEVGHIFKLGCRYTESMHARVLNRDGKETTPIMGCYGIGVERILTAAIEQSAADNAAAPSETAASAPQNGKSTLRPPALAYALHPAIAPFEVIVTITNTSEAPLAEAGERLARELSAAAIDVLLDDRDERAGVKFKDADLTGVPFRINIGKRLAEGYVELVDRLHGTTSDVPLAGVTAELQARLNQLLARSPNPAPSVQQERSWRSN